LDEVELLVGQSTAQHSLATATSGLSFAIKAALQQSIMPCMLHSPSPKCRGSPANVLPASISKRNKDASRFFMFATLYSKLIIAVNLCPLAWALGQVTPSLPRNICAPQLLLSFSASRRPFCEISRGVCEEFCSALMARNPTR
jgi:hypothetical protein